MNELYYTFRSVTAATAARHALQGGAVFCSLMRTPAKLRKQGCGYSLRIRAADRQRAEALLTRAALAYQKAYYLDGGTWREATP